MLESIIPGRGYPGARPTGPSGSLAHPGQGRPGSFLLPMAWYSLYSYNPLFTPGALWYNAYNKAFQVTLLDDHLVMMFLMMEVPWVMVALLGEEPLLVEAS